MLNDQNYPKILKDNLILLRKKNHLTQEQVGESLGVSFQAISKWENGVSLR